MKTFEQYLTVDLGLRINHITGWFQKDELNQLVLEYSNHLYDEILDDSKFVGLDPGFLLSLHDDSIYSAVMMVEDIMINRYKFKSEIDTSWLDQFINDEEELCNTRLNGEFQDEYERDFHQRSIDMSSSFNRGYYE